MRRTGDKKSDGGMERWSDSPAGDLKIFIAL